MHQYNTKMSIINQDEIIDSLFEDVLKEEIETTKTPSRKIPGPVYVAGRKLYIKVSREEGKQMADAAFKKFFRGDTDDLDDVFNKIKIIRQTGIDPSTGKTVKVRNQKEVNKTKGIREEKDFAILSKEKEIENLDKKIDNLEVRNEKKVDYLKQQKSNKEEEKNSLKTIKEADDGTPTENIQILTILLNNIRGDIQDELTAIKGYDEHAEKAEKFGLKNVAELNRSIRDEEKVHIGELQALLNKFDKEFEKSIDDGEKEAEDVLKEGKLPENIKEREYGIEEEKKFPLFDKDHVLSAIKFFNYVKPEFEKHLAKEIILRMKKYNITSENVGIENRLKKYL
jgi:rubrerythrin